MSQSQKIMGLLKNDVFFFFFPFKYNSAVFGFCSVLFTWLLSL